MTWTPRDGLYAYVPATHAGACHDACDGRTDPAHPQEPCYCSCHTRSPQ